MTPRELVEQALAEYGPDLLTVDWFLGRGISFDQLRQAVRELADEGNPAAMRFAASDKRLSSEGG